MKVLVTGCAGLIGSKFCEWLLENKGDSIVSIVGVDNLSGGIPENVPEGITFVKADLTNADDQKVIESHFPVDYVFHFAAYAAECLSPFIRQYNYTNNVISTAFLINCGIKHSVKRFVFTSSMAVYGRGEPPFGEDDIPAPIDPYGVAKYACEMDLAIAWEQHGMEYSIIRPHNVFGPNQNIWDPYRNVLGIWMYKTLEGEPMTVYGTGEQTRAFSYIDDILAPLWNAAVYEKAKNQIVNLGGMREYTLNRARELVSKVTGNDKFTYHEPRHEVKHSYCKFQKSVDVLDYKETVTFEEGLRRMWEWVKGQPRKSRKMWDSYEMDRKLYSYWK